VYVPPFVIQVTVGDCLSIRVTVAIALHVFHAESSNSNVKLQLPVNVCVVWFQLFVIVHVSFNVIVAITSSYVIHVVLYVIVPIGDSVSSAGASSSSIRVTSHVTISEPEWSKLLSFIELKSKANNQFPVHK
jgi:hypothetical protein